MSEPPEAVGTFAPGPVILCPDRLTTLAGYVPDPVRDGDTIQFRVFGDTTLAPIATLPFGAIDFAPYRDLGRVFVRAAVGTLRSDGSLDPACTATTRAQTVVFGGDPVAVRDTVVCDVRAPFRLTVYDQVFTPDDATQDVRIPSPNGGCDSTVTLTVLFDGGSVVPVPRRICEGDTAVFRGEVFDADRPTGQVVVRSGDCAVTYDVRLTVGRVGRLAPPTQELCPGAFVEFGGRRLFASDTIVLRGASESGCDSVIDVAIVNVPPPTLTYEVEAPACDPSTLTVDFRLGGDREARINVSNGGAPADGYRLRPGSNPVTFPIAGDPELFVSQFAATAGACRAGEPSSLRIAPRVSRLRARPVPSETGLPLTACPGSPLAIATVEPLDGVGPYTYRWDRGDTTRSLPEVAAGTFGVTVTDAFGCTARTTVTVVADDTLAYAVAVPPLTCPSDSAAVSIEVFADEPGLRYAFDREPLQPLRVPLIDRAGLPPGDYTFELARENGCSQSVVLAVDAPPTTDLLADEVLGIRLGDSLGFDLAPLGVTDVRWRPGELFRCDTCATTAARAVADRPFYVTAVDARGCLTEDSVAVVVTPALGVFLPTGFSPNGDGTNEAYLPLSGPEVERVLSFQVFSRWGEPVHQRFGFLPGDERAAWDGTFKGRPLDPGVYVAIATVRLVNGLEETFTGNLALVR